MLTSGLAQTAFQAAIDGFALWANAQPATEIAISPVIDRTPNFTPETQHQETAASASPRRTSSAQWHWFAFPPLFPFHRQSLRSAAESLSTQIQ